MNAGDWMSPKQDWVSKREISGLCKPKLMSSQQVQEPEYLSSDHLALVPAPSLSIALTNPT